MLKQEFEFYVSHQDELVKQYNGKYIVIVGDKVVGAYSSMQKAYLESSKTMEIGTFLIQKCSEGINDYTQTFHSRVVFA